MRAGRGEAGQASVELVAVLPIIVVVGLALWQAVVAGQALWLSGAAARAAAREVAVGGDAGAGARGALPTSLRHDLRVRTDGPSSVRVQVHIPWVLSGRSLATVESTATFPDQGR